MSTGWTPLRYRFSTNMIIKEKWAPPSEGAQCSKTVPGWSHFGSAFFTVQANHKGYPKVGNLLRMSTTEKKNGAVLENSATLEGGAVFLNNHVYTNGHLAYNRKGH